MTDNKSLETTQTIAMPDAPIGQLLGFNLIEAEQGRVVLEMDTSKTQYNPMGTLQGGILGCLADAAMGNAMGSTLNEGETFTTLELKLNFLKPLWETKLRAVGTVIKRGNTIALLECHIYDEKGSLASHSTSTCMILRGDMAEGRGIK